MPIYEDKEQFVLAAHRIRLLLEELERDIGPGSPTGAAQSPSLALDALKNALKPKWSGGGAGGGDAFTRAKAKVRLRTENLVAALMPGVLHRTLKNFTDNVRLSGTKDYRHSIR